MIAIVANGFFLFLVFFLVFFIIGLLYDELREHHILTLLRLLVFLIEKFAVAAKLRHELVAFIGKAKLACIAKSYYGVYQSGVHHNIRSDCLFFSLINSL